MAEAYIPPPPTQLPEEEPSRPGEPVRVDEPTQFTPTQQPVENADAAVIFGIDKRGSEQPQQAPGPVTVGSRDVQMAATFEPVSNERGAGTIYGQGPEQSRVNLPPPPNPIAGNLDVKFTPGPQPVYNDDEKTIMHGPNTGEEPLEPFPQADEAPATPVQTVRNEQTQFIHAPGPMYSSDTFIPPKPEAGTYQEPPRSDVISVGGGDVQIMPGSAPLNVNGDKTFGGGGDPTKMPREEEVSFAGKSAVPINVGSGEVYKTPSGDTTREAGTDDRTFAKTGQEVIGNQEAVTGAVGEPTANRDHLDPTMGGKGKPKNVRG